ncbi:MAG: hypothetical protein QOE72_3871 [Chloroflexota bacterium]|nr:hypothetical protein [Chloroflexota bacterium]
MTDRDALIQALDEWSETSCRLESLDQYTVEHEAARLDAFLRGEPVRPYDPGQEEWLEDLRREREQGKRRVRVHAFAGPLTPYLHYEIDWAYTVNAAAGEDIRLLHRATWAETPFGTRPPDFYLLDGRTVAVMEYDDVGHWLGGEVITTPDEVARYGQLWDQALDAAVPLRDYLAALRRAPWPPPIMQPATPRTSA